MPLVTYTTKNRIGYITLDRPQKRNALNYKLISELKAAFSKAETDEECKVVVLGAEGTVFSSGADLEQMKAMEKSTYNENLEDSINLLSLFHQIYQLRKLVIAQVQGLALGGGCGLAAACDLVFATPEARFGCNEVKIGFIPATAMMFLGRRIGEGRTKEMLLTGDLITAKQAAAYGLVNEVVAADKITDHIRDLALRLCRENSGHSMGLTKQMMAKAQDKKMGKALKYAAEMNAAARGSADCKKGVQNFLNKEKFEW